jgi:hypothetical protein
MYYKEFKEKYPKDFFLGGRDVSNGKEFITIYSAEKEKAIKPF